ncbi:synaptobrevin homolog YKT6-like [Styela clava]|uniref:synaptobrevin homolog YKT6-like n=1 Tax=Styela clava TaxID=7725 RepID=UPI001939F574|nr:synaptobrevin homolog YKT6-like [Styela clava]
MVKLYSISVIFKAPSKVNILKAANDVTEFGFFQRSSVAEFLKFTTQICAERTQINQRQSVKEQNYMCHVYITEERLGAVVITDHDYPRRVVFNLMSKLCEDFKSKVPIRDCSGAPSVPIQYEELPNWLAKYQDPKQADAMLRVQNELDETKIILHDTMESLLQRGEKLDDLVTKSDNLSMQSKMFYKQAKKTNSWCCAIQ